MPRPAPFSEAQARAAVAAARNWTEATRLLGYRARGGNVETVKRWVRAWAIPTDHFDPYAAQRARRGSRRPSKRPLEELLVKDSRCSRSALKKRLFDEGVKAPRCELCGQGEIWRGRRISMILDHINGVPDDNRLENLRIVCPNCAATLDTHCGRHVPRLRRCVGCGVDFAPRHLRHRYCSRSCFKGARLAAAGASQALTGYGVPQPAQRRVDRPPYEQLIAEIQATSYLAVGRKYGVSDNAVRKWVRWYEREMERAAAGPEENAEVVALTPPEPGVRRDAA